MATEINENHSTSVHLTPELPDDLKRARKKCLEIMQDYQKKRLKWYLNGPKLMDILSKDIAMFAARGISNSDDLVQEAFRAKESSSEETVMGTAWQSMLATISDDTLDTGDLTTFRNGVLWVCELKSQPNTTNSSSFPQELRGLRTRMRELTGRRRASGQKVEVAYCVLRDNRKRGQGIDEYRIYEAGDLQPENRDLDGFRYRYITGKQFWKWLTGFDSELAILMPLADLGGDLSHEIKIARENAISALQAELRERLDNRGLDYSIDSVVKFRDYYLSV